MVDLFISSNARKQGQTASREMRLIYLQVKKPQNGRIKVFTDKQATTNVPLTFLSVKILSEMEECCF